MLGKCLKYLGILTVLVGVFIAGAAYVLWQDMQVALLKPIPIRESMLFDVPIGTNVRHLSNELMTNGWIREAVFFEIEARRQKVAHQLKAGVYEITPQDTPLSMLEKITQGSVATFSLRFIEGMTFREVLAVLADTPHLRHTLKVMDEREIALKLDAQHDALEGWIFPSTYRYEANATDLSILRRAHEKMHNELQIQWENRQQELPYESPYEALVMASIIEKETGQAEERQQIAGVFVRRLLKGMKLQTDPTVIYGLGESFDGNLRRTDLRSDTPYNTYTRHGLPPTPIAMPGQASIEAAMQPAAGDALYFVAKGNGWHAFSASLREHNAAVRKYQLKK